jgi:hypothetical protein
MDMDDITVLRCRVRFRTFKSGTVKTEVRIDGSWKTLSVSSKPLEGLALKFAVDAELKKLGK